jgi:large subunit ribosomal protein L18
MLKSKMLRVVVRRSNRNLVLQLIQYHADGDKVLLAADSKELKKFGWVVNAGNTPVAYLTGFLMAKKALKKGLNEGIFDVGLHKMSKGSRIYGALKGLIDGGLKVPCSEEIFPAEDRYTGKHIENYAKMLEKDKEKYNKIFSLYLKHKVNPTELTKLFNKTKDAIVKGA